ncbi:MAG: hypothetical protein WD267_03000 [Balneolales bacterium]
MHPLVIVLLFSMLSGQCTSDNETWEGSLSLFGAEPFVQLALVTDDEERIFLEADDELLTKLWKENKGRIRIKGKKYEGEWYGKPHDYIRVEEWEWVNNE